MRLFTALHTGVTGLGVNSLAMSVIGDNISNLNTVGYKGTTAAFEDLVIQQLGGGKGQLGQGAYTAQVSQIFAQGGLEGSSSSTDFGIVGKGFFICEDSEGARFYTRAGQFQLNPEGNLVNPSNLVLQGYDADSTGALSSQLGDLEIPTDPVAGTATENVVLSVNLDSSAAVAPVITIPPPDFDTIAAEATFTSSSIVYDSLGTAREITMAWYKTGTNTWDFRAYADAADTGGTPGVPVEIFNSDLVFDTTGVLDTTLSTSIPSPVTFTGAATQTVTFDVGLGATDSGAITQYDSENSDIFDVNPDGNSSGALSFFEITTDGNITGVYSNGVTRTLGRIALANFRAEQRLTRAGHNLFQAHDANTGEPVIGGAGEGGRGLVNNFTLEMSNTDLKGEFVKMIQSQKGYQASARVVSAVDDLLQELMQMT